MSVPSVSVVTGAAGGMGRACARRFAAAGDTVVVADLDAAAVDDVAAELRAGGSAAIGVGFDITDATAVAGLAEAVRDTGPLRAVGHTAGLSPTMADWARVLSVNLVGSVLLLDALEPLVGDGTAAVCVASQAGHLVADDPALAAVLAEPLDDDFLTRANQAGIDEPGAAYSWSKWALRRLVVDRAAAWGERGGRIVSLSPGIIDTPMGRQELEQQPAMPTIIDMTPLRRMGRADEVAATVEFLCSDAASFITGTDLLVDGGSTEAIREMIRSLTDDTPPE